MKAMIFAGAFLYFAPIILACMRGHPAVWRIFAVNLVTGWTLLGWGIALAWSLWDFDKARAWPEKEWLPIWRDREPSAPAVKARLRVIAGAAADPKVTSLAERRRHRPF